MPKGAKPGERRGGRAKGTPNKATAEAKVVISHLAQTMAPDALETLGKIARKCRSPNAKVMACREILDRAYGKPPQALTLAGGGGPPIKTENSYAGSEAALQRASELLTRALGIGAAQANASSNPDGSVLPTAVRAGSGGHGTSVAAGPDSGSAE